MSEPTIEPNAAGQRMGLFKYILLFLSANTMILSLGFGSTWFYSPDYGIDMPGARVVGEIIGGAALLSPLFWLVWGLRHRRLWVYGYSTTISVLSVIYSIFTATLIGPILCLVASALWRTVIFTGIAIIAAHIHWQVWQETKHTMKKLHYPERAFVDTGDVIVFDKSIFKKWQKTRKEVVTPTRLYFWFCVILSPFGPALGVIFGDHMAVPVIPIIFLALSPYLARYTWSKLPVCIGALMVYPIYLELKKGKPVIATGFDFSR